MFFEGNIWLIEISFKYYNKKKIEELYSSYVLYIFG